MQGGKNAECRRGGTSAGGPKLRLVWCVPYRTIRQRFNSRDNAIAKTMKFLLNLLQVDAAARIARFVPEDPAPPKITSLPIVGPGRSRGQQPANRRKPWP